VQNGCDIYGEEEDEWWYEMSVYEGERAKGSLENDSTCRLVDF